MIRPALLAGALVGLTPLAASAQAPAAPVGPTLPVAGLLQKSETEVRARLGQPVIARREAGGAMWTYRADACALFVFFKAQGREGMRVSGAATGPRKRGQPTLDVPACVAAVAKS